MKLPKIWNFAHTIIKTTSVLYLNRDNIENRKSIDGLHF